MLLCYHTKFSFHYKTTYVPTLYIIKSFFFSVNEKSCHFSGNVVRWPPGYNLLLILLIYSYTILRELGLLQYQIIYSTYSIHFNNNCC